MLLPAIDRGGSDAAPHRPLAPQCRCLAIVGYHVEKPPILMKLPRPTLRWALLLFALVLAIGLFAPLPIRGRVAGTLGDSLHAPAFAVLAFLVYRLLTGLSWPGPRWVPWVTCCSLIALGIATEAMQYCVGRHLSLKDIVADSLGVVAGTLWAIAAASPPKRFPRVLRASAVALVILAVTPTPLNLIDTALQHYDFPVIGSFEHPLERLRWRTWWTRIRRSPRHATDGDWSLRLDLRPGDYPGIATGVPIPDWSAYDELAFDVELTGGPPLDGYVIIEDRPSRRTADDRFERRFRLEPGPQQIVIPLADVERGPRTRRLDLSQVSLLQFFTVDLKEPRTLFLDNIRLRRQGSPHP